MGKKNWPSWAIVLNADLRVPRHLSEAILRATSSEGRLFHRLPQAKVLVGGRLVP